jgi:hypothetical protein
MTYGGEPSRECVITYCQTFRAVLYVLRSRYGNRGVNIWFKKQVPIIFSEVPQALYEEQA